LEPDSQQSKLWLFLLYSKSLVETIKFLLSVVLTRKQKRIYDWIKRFIQEHGYAPSYDKIRKYSGFNLNLLLYKGFQKFLLR